MNKKIKKPFGQRICEAFELPVGTLGNCSSIEALGKCEARVGGCEGLVSYTQDEVVLKLCDGMLTVRGRNLELRSFRYGQISVLGQLDSILYGDGGEYDDR